MASSFPADGSLEDLRDKIWVLCNTAAEFANTTAVHALAAGFVVALPSPADFQRHMPALEAQNCRELAQAGRVIGTLGNPNGQRIYHPFWDAIPFYQDCAGLHPTLIALLACENRFLEDAYNEHVRKPVRNSMEVEMTIQEVTVPVYKPELLIFGLKLGEVHPVNDREFRYLAMKRQRVELQHKLWRGGKAAEGAGPYFDNVWNAVYPERAAWPLPGSGGFRELAVQQNALAFPQQTAEGQQQPAGPPPKKRVRRTKESDAPTQTTHGATAAPNPPNPPNQTFENRVGPASQRQRPDPVSTETALKARITSMDARYTRDMTEMQKQLADVRKELEDKNRGLNAKNQELITKNVQLTAKVARMRNLVQRWDEQIVELEMEETAAREENTLLHRRVKALTAENAALQGKLDGLVIRGGVGGEGGEVEEDVVMK